MCDFDEIFNEAKKVLNVRELSPFVKIGNISCVLVTNDNIYTGININDSSAEYSAIVKMVNNGENVVKRIIVINELEEIIEPKLNEIEYLLSLSAANMNTEVILAKDKVVRLCDLLPDWFGTYRKY